MRRNLLVVLLVAAVSSLCMWRTGTAQGQNRPGSAGFEARVALVDLAFIFKNYKSFTNLMDQMKADVQSREKQITQAQADLKDMLNRRGQLNPESTTYRETDAAIAKKKAELELDADRARREFTQREANIYHQTYREVEGAIKRYADANGITLVLRAARDEADVAANPQDVIKEVSQQVIYALPHMDITDQVLDLLNRSAAPTHPVKGPSMQPGTKPFIPQQAPKTTGPAKDKAGTIKR